MRIGNWKIGARLGAAFGLMLVLLVASTIFSLSSLKLLNDGTDELVNDKYPKVIYAYEILDVVNRNARFMRNMLLWDDPGEIEKERKNILKNKKENEENFEKLAKMIHTERGEELLRAVMDARAQYGRSQSEFMALVSNGDKDDATKLLLTQIRKDQRNYLDLLRSLIRYQTEIVAKRGNQAVTTYQETRLLLLGLSIFAVLLGGAVAFWISRSIVAPLQTAVKVANAAAAGDLSSKVEVSSKDETGQLLQALKEMNEGLATIVGQVRSGASAVATASQQIASGNLDLSSRTEQQAGSLEEAASSMEELIGTVRQNSENATQANGLAKSASEIAFKGGEVVAQVVTTMAGINTSSREVVEIIGVIDDIAFQTNILSLNAAVEAARAGEQGRGFAVVASEVRRLAQRAADAAKEIRTLIVDSVEKVEVGTKLVAEAGSTMNEIVASVQRVTDIMGEITVAGREQAAGIEQVNATIIQMDQTTQKNAALVEEAAAASASLQEQARELARTVSVFRVAEVSTSAVSAAQAANSREPSSLAANRVNHRKSGLAPKKMITGTSAVVNGEWEEF